MKLIVYLCLVALSVCEETDITTASTENYQSFVTYDDPSNINIETVVGNFEILKGFFKCFMDEGFCGNAASRFKSFLPAAAFKNACARCSRAEKHNLRRFMEELRHHYPHAYQRFKKKYDPFGDYLWHLMEVIQYE